MLIKLDENQIFSIRFGDAKVITMICKSISVEYWWYMPGWRRLHV